MNDHLKLGVSPEKAKALLARLARLGVREGDLVEKFIRSSGPGGQNVNKVATAVYLRHEASGLEVKAQQSRSQARNRFEARRMLAEALEEKILGARSERQQEAERIRRQKRRRSRRAQARILDDKRRQAHKKEERRAPRKVDASGEG